MPVAVDPQQPTVVFSTFIAQSRGAALPAHVERAANRAFTNWMACALGGARDSITETTLRVAVGLSGRDDASAIGRSEKLDVVNAALVNAVAANALDYDDMHAPTLIHPTVPVVASALALGEHRGISGRVLLNAITAGIEVECRLGLVLFPAHYDAGWHITATLGTLGACAAACVVIGLDRERTQHALGIAATQAGGLRAMLSNSCKSFNIGKAASSGVLAALLAEAGLDSEREVLEARHGLFDVFGKPHDAEQLTRDLGKRYLLPDVSLKPYPCGVVVHPLIDACIAVASARTGTSNIRRVSARVHPRAVELADRRHPANALEGRYSLQHAAALALTQRAAGLSTFENADVNDRELARLRERITLESDPRLNASQARVQVEVADGERLDAAVDQPSGSPERPLSDAQLRSKFMDLATRTLDVRAGEGLYTLCSDVANVGDVREIVRHARAETQMCRA